MIGQGADHLVAPQRVLGEGALALLRQHSIPGGKAHHMAIGRDGGGHHRLEGDWVNDAGAGVVIVLDRRLIPMAPPCSLCPFNARPPAPPWAVSPRTLHIQPSTVLGAASTWSSLLPGCRRIKGCTGRCLLTLGLSPHVSLTSWIGPDKAEGEYGWRMLLDTCCQRTALQAPRRCAPPAQQR